MSRRSNYTAKFKTKIVLEVFKEEKELGVIAAENNLNPNMVRKWRKEFLENAESVFENPTHIEKDFQRKEDDLKKQLMARIDYHQTKQPYLGTRRIAKLLNNEGFKVGGKLVRSLMAEMGIRAICPKPNLSVYFGR